MVSLLVTSISFFKKILFIYLAALGLSCSMWDLAPRPGIEPGPPALGESLSHWTTREVPISFSYRLCLVLAVLRRCCCSGFSLAAASGSYSPDAPCRLLIAVASLAAERRRVGATLRRAVQAPHRGGLSCCGAQASAAMAPWL